MIDTIGYQHLLTRATAPQASWMRAAPIRHAQPQSFVRRLLAALGC